MGKRAARPRDSPFLTTTQRPHATGTVAHNRSTGSYLLTAAKAVLPLRNAPRITTRACQHAQGASPQDRRHVRTELANAAHMIKQEQQDSRVRSEDEEHSNTEEPDQCHPSCRASHSKRT